MVTEHQAAVVENILLLSNPLLDTAVIVHSVLNLEHLDL